MAFPSFDKQIPQLWKFDLSSILDLPLEDEGEFRVRVRVLGRLFEEFSESSSSPSPRVL